MGDTSAQLANGLARLVNSYLAIIPSHHHIALLIYLSVRSDIGDPAGTALSLDFRSAASNSHQAYLVFEVAMSRSSRSSRMAWRRLSLSDATKSPFLCLFSMWRRLHLYCKRQVEDCTCMKHCIEGTSSIQFPPMLTCRFRSSHR